VFFPVDASCLAGASCLMAEVAVRLNEILADERACRNTLQLAEVRCRDPGQKELIRRVLAAYDQICTELENIVRAIGGVPVPTQAAQFSPQPPEASLTDTLKTAESNQRDIIAPIDAVLEEHGLPGYGEPLLAIRQFHTDNIRWLAEALGTRQ